MTDSCSVCHFERILHHGMSEPTCSDFCVTQSDEVKKAFSTLQLGDIGVWPCSRCGCAVEDEYDSKDSFCSSCWRIVKTERLRQALQDLIDHMVPTMWAHLESRGLSEIRCTEIKALAKR